MTDLEFCQRIAASRRHRAILASAAMALALSGCATTAPVVPAQLLTCQRQPRSPAAQRDVGL